MSGANILPTQSVGRGTMRSMVEGYMALEAGAFYPSTTLRVVPLPICDGEA
jgi:hypothetical protein